MEANIPEDLRYTESDEWVRRDGDEVVSGVTAFAAEQLGDVVYVQLPGAKEHYDQGQSYGEIESVKAVSDLYAPLAGEIVDVNFAINEDSGLVNEDPYGAGWLVRLKPDNPADYDSLLDAAAYGQSVADRS